MALGEQIFNGVPSLVWLFLHAIAVITAIYFLVKVHFDKPLTWAFILYAISAALFILVFLDMLDLLLVHVISSVFILISIILIGVHSRICCR